MSACGWSRRSCSRRRGASGAAGASLKQEGVTDVADAHRFGVRWQRQLVVGTAVAVNVSAVPAVVLKGRHKSDVRCATPTPVQTRMLEDSNRAAHFSPRDGEFLLALLTLCGFVVFQPGVTLNGDTTRSEENGTRKTTWLTYS